MEKDYRGKQIYDKNTKEKISMKRKQKERKKPVKRQYRKRQAVS